MKQLQITKVKPVPKAVAKTVIKHAHKPAAGAEKLTHFIQDFARPKHGAALFAHTQVFLDLSGIAGGKAYPRSKAAQVIGSTAVKYHLSNTNLEATSEGLKLTDKGYMFFSARPTVDPELVKAFTDVLTTGHLNAVANVKSTTAVGVIK
jgi:hypothetical protein